LPTLRAGRRQTASLSLTMMARTAQTEGVRACVCVCVCGRGGGDGRRGAAVSAWCLPSVSASASRLASIIEVAQQRLHTARCVALRPLLRTLMRRTPPEAARGCVCVSVFDVRAAGAAAVMCACV
jgi:hypothetical protein